MTKTSHGAVVWSLKRHNLQEDMWDHICPVCRATTPVFVHEYPTEEGRLRFSYLCETCAQKKVAMWLGYAQDAGGIGWAESIDFDIATVHHNQENDEETLTLTRWGQEQRRRRLQVAE